MPIQPHLTSKNGQYYFRIAIPKELRTKIHKSELIYSLRTKCRYEAKARCITMFGKTQVLFKEFQNMPRLTPEQAKEIIKSYFKEALICLEQQMNVVDDYSDMLATFAKNESLDLTGDRHRLDFLYPDQFYDNKGHAAIGVQEHNKPDLAAITDMLQRSHNLHAQKGSYSYQVLKKAAERAVQELLNVHRQYVDFETDIKINDDLFLSSNPVVSATMPPVELSVVKLPISGLFDKYLAECKRNDESQSSLTAKRACYDLWLEISTDHSIGDLTPEMAGSFKDALLKLPKNKSKCYPNHSITQLLNMPLSPDKKLSNKTINEYLIKMSSFYNWAIDNHHTKTDKNYFKSLRIKQKNKRKAIDSRQPFSAEQLISIFSTPIYKGCEDNSMHGRFVAGDMVFKDHYYWIPLIALYTGARMSEILQLTTQDVKQENDYWFFDINDRGDDKNLKTIQSKRRIPIHSALIDAGLIDYCFELEKTEKGRLFHQIKPYGRDYSHRYSKWFSRYLERYKIKTDKTSFHSFRHNFRDELKGKVNETLLRALLGHEKGDAHSMYGSSQYDLKDLKLAIEKLNLPIK